MMALLSHSSWLYDTYVGCDMNWYYVCGRAMVRGLVPYVDFTDSKGPLLWLIYGLGYLASPHSFMGVFWLECLSLIATLWIARRLAALLLGERPLLNALAVALLAFALLYTTLEWRCERWCWPLLLYPVYGTMLMATRGADGCGKAVVLKTGICMGLAFMMKYSIAAIIAAVALWQLYEAWQQRRASLAAMLGRLVLGTLAAMAPFLIYLLCRGALAAFVQEYIVNTLFTIGNLNDMHYAHAGFLHRLYAHYKMFFGWHVISWNEVAQGLSGLLFLVVYWKKRYRWVALYCVATCAAIYALGFFYYYSEIGNVLIVLGIIALLTLLQRVPAAATAAVQGVLLGAAVLACLAYGAFYFDRCSYSFNKHNVERTIYHTSLNIVARQGRFCCMMYYDAMPAHGDLGLKAEALPACRDWARQNGNRERTLRNQRAAIEQRVPDVIVVNRKQADYRATQRYLLNHGYHAVTFATAAELDLWQQGQQEIFLRHALVARMAHVSDADVLLLRR